MQGTQLRYVIKFVAEMEKAVKFYRDVLGRKVKFESPGWSEFVTDETTLALHPYRSSKPTRSQKIALRDSTDFIVVAERSLGKRWIESGHYGPAATGLLSKSSSA